MKAKAKLPNRRVQTLAFTLLGSIILTFLGINSASAHAQLINTFPASGSDLTTPPNFLTLTWGEDVKTSSEQIILLDNNSQKVPSLYTYSYDPLKHTGTVTLKPKIRLTNGSYILSWKVISADSHLVGGAFSFGLNAKSAIIKKQSNFNIIDKSLEYIFWLLLILLFGSLLASRKKFITLSLSLLFLTSISRLLYTYHLLGKFFIETSTFRLSVLTLVFVSFAYLLLKFIKYDNNIIYNHKPHQPHLVQLAELPQNLKYISRIFLLALTSTLFASQAFLEGHALDLKKYAFLPFLSFTHLFAGIVWFGGITALMLRRTRDQYLITRKLSQYSISFLLVAAPLLTYFLLGNLKNLTVSSWVEIMFIKTLLLGATLAIGAYHHFYGEKFLKDPNFKPSKTLTLEFGAALSLLVASLFLVSYSPPSILKLDLAQSQTTALLNTTYQNDLTFDNGATATLTLSGLELHTPTTLMIQINGKKSYQKNMDLYLSNPTLNITDLHVTLTGEENHYMGLVNIPAKGDWHLHAELMVDDFTQMQTNLNLTIK